MRLVEIEAVAGPGAEVEYRLAFKVVEGRAGRLKSVNRAKMFAVRCPLHRINGAVAHVRDVDAGSIDVHQTDIALEGIGVLRRCGYCEQLRTRLVPAQDDVRRSAAAPTRKHAREIRVRKIFHVRALTARTRAVHRDRMRIGRDNG